MSEIGNHCLNCGNADIHDGKIDWFICCQKRMQKMTEMEINCKDFTPRPALKALLDIFNED